MFDKLFLQRNYADQVGMRIPKYRVQQYSPYRANFRCPICGDSQKNKFKKRGYILEKNSSLMFYCHNECGTINFEKFLELHHGDLYTQYRFDLFQLYKDQNNNSPSPKEEYIEPELFKVEVEDLKGLIPLNEAPIPVQRYIKKRMIPEDFYDEIFYTDQFFEYINTKIPLKFGKGLLKEKDHRIVLPMYDEDGKIFGVIGRSLNPNSTTRYLTVKFNEAMPKIYGLERLDRNKFVYFTEGPIDSYFVDNCLALAGTDGNPSLIISNPQRYGMILDNQPRSISVLKKYEKYIRMGCYMFIWPESISEDIKDLNDWAMTGISHEEMMEIIRVNTFNDAMLRIRFNNWRKY